MKKEKKSNKPARILPSFLKGLRILQYIAAHPGGVRLSDVADGLDLPASNTTLYLNTLMSAGLLVRDPVRRHFFIAPDAIELFRHADKGLIHHLIHCAEKPMQALFSEFNENVLLALQKDHRVFFIKHISSNHLMNIRIEPDPDYPMHVTAAGRAILAFLPEKEIDAYIQKAVFEKITSKTVASEKALRDILRETRDNGYAFNPGEFEEDVMAVSAPILAGGRPLASLVVQFPTLRHSTRQATEAASSIQRKAQEIQKALIPS